MLESKYGLDLDAAWKRSLRRAHRAEVPDILRWEDHQLAWPEWKAQLVENLDLDKYRPQQAAIVEVPKDGFTVRPFALLHPIDHAVYEAVVGKNAESIDAVLPAVTVLFSSRFDVRQPGTYKLHKQLRAWQAFQEVARDLYYDYDEAFMLTTDVASYFEYVEIGILITELMQVPNVDHQAVRLLALFLNQVQRTSDIWGLPQGPEASGILGNFYLVPVDRALSGQPVSALRFGDDIKVFGGEARDLRIALRDITRIMRNRHLNISIRKTKLLQGEEILKELEDARKDAIQYGLKVGNPAAVAAVRELFDEAVAADPIESRDVRFAVYRLQQNADPHAIPWILDHLASAPFLAALLVEYLSSHLTAGHGIEERVRAFLGDPGVNIYSYVEMQLIRMFSNAETIEDQTLEIIKAIGSDANRETYVREHAIRCAGIHARPGDAAALRTMFNSSTDQRVRRALLVAATEAGGIDKGWLTAVADADPVLAHTAIFLYKITHLPNP